MKSQCKNDVHSLDTKSLYWPTRDDTHKYYSTKLINHAKYFSTKKGECISIRAHNLENIDQLTMSYYNLIDCINRAKTPNGQKSKIELDNLTSPHTWTILCRCNLIILTVWFFLFT